MGRAGKPNVLQQIQLPVVPNEKCKEGLRKYRETDFSFSDIILCAGFSESGKGDTCTGDSGGPMMLPQFINGKFPYYQIGIVSWGKFEVQFLFVFYPSNYRICILLISHAIRPWLCWTYSRCLHKCRQIRRLDS